MAEVMKSLKSIIIGIGILGVVIVLLSIILVQMKSTSGVACLSTYTYNTTADNCYLTTNASVTTAVNSLAGTIDSTTTAIATPVTYFGLIILVVVFVFLLGFLITKLEKSGKD